MQFVAYGHANIEGTHKTTFEITQHASVTPKGDCVIGTRAAFEADAIAGLAQVSKRLKITLKAGMYSETIVGDSNPAFVPGPDIVVRKTDFVSPRTLVMNADKAAADFSRKFVDALKNPETHVDVTIERA